MNELEFHLYMTKNVTSLLRGKFYQIQQAIIHPMSRDGTYSTLITLLHRNLGYNTEQFFNRDYLHNSSDVTTDKITVFQSKDLSQRVTFAPLSSFNPRHVCTFSRKSPLFAKKKKKSHSTLSSAKKRWY